MSRLAHQLLDDGRVIVSFVGRSQSMFIDASEAKRFCWAVLSDLDPDGAEEAGYQPAPIVIEQPARTEPKEYRAGAWQKRAILELIEAGVGTSVRIAQRLDIKPNNVCVQLCHLRTDGVISQLTKGRPHFPGRWAITTRGRSYLEMARREDA